MKNELVSFGISILSVCAAGSDAVKGKIYNWITLPGMLLGLLAGAWLGGWSGLGLSVVGMALGLVLFGWMFFIGHMGGGDVKLLMALGAWGGYSYVTEVALLSIAIGGLAAIILLFFSGRLTAFVSKMYWFAVSLRVKGMPVQIPTSDKTFKMPFGIPMAIAAVWAVFDDPFLRLGISLW